MATRALPGRAGVRLLSRSLALRAAPRGAGAQPRLRPQVTSSICRSFHNKTTVNAQPRQLPASGENTQYELSDTSMSIRWPDGRSSNYDYQFLFDHCRCPRCFHPKTKQRLKTLETVSPRLKPSSVSIEGGQLKISWESAPDHPASFPLSFLQQASYDPPLSSRSELLDKIPRKTWGASIAANPPTVSYDSVMPELAGDKAEDGVLTWLNNIYEYGFCFVSGVPATAEATEALIRRMSFIRETLYGGFWDFTADMSKGDLAYSNESLPAHTDTAYFTDPAGLQIFHCLSHPIPPGSGGETLLVDGFYAAQKLAIQDESAYATLSRLAVPYHASGNEGNLLRPPVSQPVLRHDHMGELQQVRWNNEDRSVLGEGWTPTEVREWYEAARAYQDILTNKDTEYWVKLSPGTVVVIDNWRVMHGRAAFTGQRRMCGAYVGADDWRSRRRALLEKTKIGVDSWSSGW